MKTVKLLILVLMAISISWRSDPITDRSSSLSVGLRNNDDITFRALSDFVTKPMKTYSHGTLEVFGNPFPFNIHGEGNATHLGIFSAEHSATMTGNGPSITGTMKSANGDEISVESYSFYFSPDGLEHIDYWIKGGTGRFEGATGELRTTGAVDWSKTPPSFYFNGEGYINVPKNK